jgi:hypothetical protein
MQSPNMSESPERDQATAQIWEAYDKARLRLREVGDAIGAEISGTYTGPEAIPNFDTPKPKTEAVTG